VKTAGASQNGELPSRRIPHESDSVCPSPSASYHIDPNESSGGQMSDEVGFQRLGFHPPPPGTSPHWKICACSVSSRAIEGPSPLPATPPYVPRKKQANVIMPVGLQAC